jgi:hypothetical protein
VLVPLPQLQPDQKAIGHHHRDGMPMEAWPQPPLIVIPAQLPSLNLSRFVAA